MSFSKVIPFNIVNALIILFLGAIASVLVMVVYFALVVPDQQRQQCERDHGTCVDTTDGWKPYR